MLKASFVIDTDMSIVGFAEGYLTGDNSRPVNWIDGGIILSSEASFNYNHPFVLSGIPMYLETGLSMELEARLNLFCDQNAKGFTPYGEISAPLKVNIGVGAGVKKVLYFGGGFEGKLNAEAKIQREKPDYQKITATLNGYLKAGLLCFEVKQEFDPIIEKIIYESNGNYVAKKTYDLNYAKLYDTKKYTRKDLSYLQEQSDFVAKKANGNTNSRTPVMASGVVENELIKTNVYRESTMQYGYLRDGKKVAVWLDSESDDPNDVQLYYSRQNDSNWDWPMPVAMDGTMDYAPQVFTFGDETYLIWLNATRAITDEDTLDSFASVFDIAVARYDGYGFYMPEIISNPGLDMLPVMCGDDEHKYIIWVHNTEDDWFGEEGKNEIYYSEYVDGAWSAPIKAYEGLDAIDCLAADYRTDLRIAYCMETENGPRLFENGIRVNDEELTESHPVYCDHVLYWSSDGIVQNANGGKADNLCIVGDYQIFDLSYDRPEVPEGEPNPWADEPRNKAMLYTTGNGLTSKLCVSFYYDALDKWSDPIELTDGSTFIGAFAGFVDPSGYVTAIYNSQQVVGDYESENPYGTADLMSMKLMPFSDLSVGNVYYDADDYNAGNEMGMSFDLTNNGSMLIEKVKVEIYDEQDQLLNSSELDEIILPGQTVLAQSYFNVDSDANGQTVRIRILPGDLYGNYAEDNEEDNNVSVTFEYEDLVVEKIAWAYDVDEEVVIKADIVNRGYATRENVRVTLRKGAADGEILDTVELLSVEPLALDVAGFTLPEAKDDIFYVVIEDSEDVYLTNDYDYVYLNLDADKEALEITRQPRDWYGTFGKKASFNVEATGKDLVYDWQFKKKGVWQSYGLTTSDTANFKVTMNTTNIKYPIRCVITDAYERQIITKEVWLKDASTSSPIAITVQPIDWYGTYGKKARFIVEAAGNGLTYQWQYKKSTKWVNYDITTADTKNFKVSMNEKNINWPIRCLITDEDGYTAATDEVWMKLQEEEPEPVPEGPEIVLQPIDWYGVYGKKASFTVEAIGEGLTYQWQYKKGTVWTDYAIITADTPNLKVTMNEKNIKWALRCVITDAEGKQTVSNEVWMKLKETEIVESEEIIITTQPTDWYGVFGKKATFSVTAIGNGLTYQWQYKKGGDWNNYGLETADTPSFKVTMNEKNVKWALRCVITDSEGHTVTTNEVWMRLVE